MYLAGRAALVQYTPAVRARRSMRSSPLCGSIPSTRWPGPGWPWPVRTNICGSRPPKKSSAGPGGQRPKPARPWRSIRILAEAHLARAAVARKREFDWSAAIESSRRALLLNPNLPQAHLIIAAAYYHLGYMEEASIALDHGRRLGGDDVVEPERIDGLIALFSGRFAPALAHLEEVSRLSSDAIGDTYLALAYFYSGSPDRGRAMLEALAGHRSASTAARAGAALAGVLAALGETRRATEHLQRVLAGKYRDHHVAYGLGAAYAQLGDQASALQWLHVAADTGFPSAPWFDADPLLAPLRETTDFAPLTAHVNTRRQASRAASP